MSDRESPETLTVALAQIAPVWLDRERTLDKVLDACREAADGGRPSVVSDPEGAAALAYRTIAIAAGAALAGGRRDYSHAFPEIVVEDS